MNTKHQLTPIGLLQLRWDSWNEMCEFAGIGKLENNKPTGCYLGENDQPLPSDKTSERLGLLIPTEEGLMVAREGDWIVLGAKKRLSVIKSEAFGAVHQSINEALVDEAP